MKVINYMCNRCGKQIDSNGIYTIIPGALDQNGDSTIEIKDEIFDELCDLLEDKHLCLSCLKKVLKYFGAPAVPNPEFEKALMQVPVLDLPIHQDKPTNRTPAPEKEIDYEAEIKSLIDSGLSVKQVAEKISISEKTLYKWMKKYGIQPPHKAKIIEPVPVPEKKVHDVKLMTVEAVKKAYILEGKNIPDLAKEFGITIQEVHNFLVKNNIVKDAKAYASYVQTHATSPEIGGL